MFFLENHNVSLCMMNERTKVADYFYSFWYNIILFLYYYDIRSLSPPLLTIFTHPPASFPTPSPSRFSNLPLFPSPSPASQHFFSISALGPNLGSEIPFSLSHHGKIREKWPTRCGYKKNSLSLRLITRQMTLNCLKKQKIEIIQ